MEDIRHHDTKAAVAGPYQPPSASYPPPSRLADQHGPLGHIAPHVSYPPFRVPPNLGCFSDRREFFAISPYFAPFNSVP